jgi:hypothetical protein
MKVTTYTDNVKGTVMVDMMAHTHHLNNQLLEKQNKLQEQIDIATLHNNKQKQLQTMVNNVSSECILPALPAVMPTIKKKKLRIVGKQPKNLTINSVCSSVQGLDDEDNTPINKLVNDSKKRKQQKQKTKEFDLTVQVHDKIINKKIIIKQGRKPNKGPNRKNAKNLDPELDEKDFIWEIERDWTLEFFRRNTVMKSKRQDLVVMALENYRKRKGEYEGELLIRWKDGRREWTNACAAKTDAKAKMYNAALKKFNLTNEQLQYGLTRAHNAAIEKQKNKLILYDPNKKQKEGKYSISTLIYQYLFSLYYYFFQLTDTNNNHDIITEVSKEADLKDTLPDDIEDLPDKTSNLPDEIEDLPDTIEDLPDKIANLPLLDKKIPKKKSKVPDTTHTLPDGSQDIPDKNTNLPDSIDTLPDVSQNLPDINANFPDVNANVPLSNMKKSKKKTILPGMMMDTSPDVRYMTPIPKEKIVLPKNYVGNDFNGNEIPYNGMVYNSSFKSTTQKLVNIGNDLPDENLELPDMDQTRNGDLPDKANELPDESTNLPDIEQVINQKIVDLPDEANVLPDISKHLPDNKVDLPNETGNLTETINTPVTKFICEIDKEHECQFLAEKSNSAWCKPNAMFHEVLCQGDSCGKMFVNQIVKTEKNIKPSCKKPMHVCSNERSKCTYALCHDCYKLAMQKFFKEPNEKSNHH